jgi:hypothetical protein
LQLASRVNFRANPFRPAAASCAAARGRENIPDKLPIVKLRAIAADYLAERSKRRTNTRPQPLPFFAAQGNNGVMHPEPPLQPESDLRSDPRDEAVEAIVFDQHPALSGSGGVPYPYGRPSQSPFAEANGPSEARHEGPSDRSVGSFLGRFTRPPDFAVPKRFGMSAILGITTALAILFGGLKWGNAWPVFYLFFGGQAIVICLVQMFVGSAPRLASTIAGAIIMPVFAVLAVVLADRGPRLDEMACMLPFFIPFGALLGYITGTCAAGIFLIMDYLEPYLQGRPSLGSQRHSAGASS